MNAGDDPASRPAGKRRRVLWLLLGVVVVLALIAFVTKVVIREPSDSRADDALPDNVTIDPPGWTTRGSLAGDAGFLRKASRAVGADEGDGRDLSVLWAGRAEYGSYGAVDLAVFAARPRENRFAWEPREREYVLAWREEDGEWGMNDSPDELPGLSLDNSVIPLPVDWTEGQPKGYSKFYLLRDDVTSARRLDGRRLETEDGVVAVPEGKMGMGCHVPAFWLDTAAGPSYTNPLLIRDLSAGWERSEAEALLSSISPPGCDGGGVLALEALDHELVQFATGPRPVRFPSGTGFVVSLAAHTTELGTRRTVAVAVPGKDAVFGAFEHTRPISARERDETGSSPEGTFAVRVPTGLPGGQAVVATGGEPKTDPKLDALASGSGTDSPTIFRSAGRGSVAVTWQGRNGRPDLVALVPAAGA